MTLCRKKTKCIFNTWLSVVEHQDQFYLSQHLHTHQNCTFIFFSICVIRYENTAWCWRESNLIPLAKSPAINNNFFLCRRVHSKTEFRKSYIKDSIEGKAKGWALDDANGDILQHLLHFNYVKQWYFMYMWWFFGQEVTR